MLWTMETAALLIPMLFLLIGLAVTMLIDPYISRKHRVVMLIIIALSAFLIAYIRTGADIVSRTTDIPPEFVSIIQGIIIVLVAAQMFLSGFRRKLIFRSAKKALAQKEEKA